jgi:Ser/Thr protein kinase RdoA (MazF antagonist)
MMALSRIRAMSLTIDARWCSPVADQVAAAFGYPAGDARLVRSSATHVFVLPGEPARYLRMVHADQITATRFEAVAALAERMGEAGAAVAVPVRSPAGRLIETVPTALGTMHAMVVAAAPGVPVELDGMDVPAARAWGRALGQFHAAAATCVDPRDGLSEPLAGLDAVATRYPHDAALGEAVEILRRWRDRLARDPRAYGVVHGDFELDNLAWAGGRPTAFDLDEAGYSWYAADIAYALRDLGDGVMLPAPAHRGLFAAFLDGYRGVRPLPPEDAGRLSVFTAANAALSLARLIGVEDAGPESGDPDWLVALRAKVDAYLRRQRATVLAGAALVAADTAGAGAQIATSTGNARRAGRSSSSPSPAGGTAP